jgi:hypothetical protein
LVLTMLFKRVVIFRLISTGLSLSVRSSHHKPDVPFDVAITSWLDQESIPWKPSSILFPSQHNVLEIGSSRPFLLHTIPSPVQTITNDSMPPWLCQHMTTAAAPWHDIVHLHQDIWDSKTDIVQSRLKVKSGMITNRIFARKTSVHRIPNDVARAFFLQNHLWGATKAKFIYGLFVTTTNNMNNTRGDTTNDETTLVAAASFSSGRIIYRNGVPHCSHEFLRFCTLQNTTIVGGLSKLLQAFIREQSPDDIVTQIDRNWGDGSSWCKLGFTSVSRMPPLLMGIGLEDGVRRHLIGAGIKSPTNTETMSSSTRIGLPLETLDVLSQLGSAAPETVLDCLRAQGFLPIYDSGVERLCMLVPNTPAAQTLQQTYGNSFTIDDLTRRVWEESVPKCPTEYYSTNPGIMVLLNHAKEVHAEDQVGVV